jgi:hypothetical protein
MSIDTKEKMNEILLNENDDYQIELRRISNVPSSII